MATITGFTSARMLAIENSTIVDGEIVGDDLILLTRDATPINAGSVRGPEGPVGPTGDVSTAQLNAAIAAAHGAGAITETQLANGSVTNVKLGADAVTASKLADLAVGQEHIQTGAVTTVKLANGAVTSTQLAANAVGSSQVASAAITSAKIANNAITSAHLSSGSVTSAAIASGAVTSSGLASDAVTTAKIAAGAVTNAKLATDSVNATQIVASAVTTAKIAANAVTLAKIEQTSWTTMTLGSGWSPHDVDRRAPRYRKLFNSVVFVEGVQRKSSNISIGETLFTLPAGFRPTKKLSIPVAISDEATQSGNTYGNARVFISDDGVGTLYGINHNANDGMLDLSYSFMFSTDA